MGHAAADQAGARPYLHRCAGNALRHATSGAAWHCQAKLEPSLTTAGGKGWSLRLRPDLRPTGSACGKMGLLRQKEIDPNLIAS